MLSLTLHDDSEPRHAGVRLTDLVIAGWTGRDMAEVQKHIDELAAIGVTPPASVPVFYRVSSARATHADMIEVTGGNSSGEAECVLLAHDGRLWIGVGSDHTDRTVEAYGITVSKQMCDKPVGHDFWPLLDVAGHWDRLILRGYADGALYQEGSVSLLRAPRDLVAAYGALSDGMAMFCGTMPVIGPVRPAARFAVELEDPVRGRVLRHEYGVRVLPVNG